MKTRKVLIADDSVAVCSAGEIFFSGKGYTVLTANDGAEALAVAAEEKPEYILLDVVMPERDGFQVCYEIRKDPEIGKAIIIIFSGNVPDVEQGFEYGADDCVVKPLNWAVIEERMVALGKEKWGNSGQ